MSGAGAGLTDAQKAEVEQMVALSKQEPLTAKQILSVGSAFGWIALAVVTLFGAGLYLFADNNSKTTAERVALKTASDLAPRAVQSITTESVIQGLLGATNFDEFVKSRAPNLPIGAVMIFDVQDGCPKDDGWEPLDRAAGRVIVGVGAGKLSDGALLTSRDYNAQGGQERVALRRIELPGHSHEISSANHTVAGQSDGRVITTLVGGKHNSSETYMGVFPDRHGKGEAHENMPPFIALHFCKKVT